jgi:phage FluMu protein Com
MSTQTYKQKTCPKCGSLDVERVRRNWFEKLFFSHKYFCRYCAKTLYRVDQREVRIRTK